MTERRMAEAKQIFEIIDSERKTKLNAKYKFKKINKIDNIDVEVIIHSIGESQNNHEVMYYIIRSTKILREFHDEFQHYILYSSVSFDDKKVLDITLLQKLLDDLHDKIKLMKMDKIFGKLRAENCEEDFDEYIGGEECCVCYHETLTLTDCKHRVCISCWNEMFNNNLYKCPICKRNHIMVYSGHCDKDE